jgi:hypothetical protein
VFTARYGSDLSVLSRLDSEKNRPCQAQAVSRWPLIAETRVGSQVTSRAMWWTKWLSDGFPPATSVFPAIISPQVLHNRLRLNATLSEEQADTAWEPSEKAVLC